MDEATRLIESGYRSISNSGRTVARLDHPDWRERMARDHTRGFRGDSERNLEIGMRWVATLGDGAADHYRRVHSKDRVSCLPQEVYDRVRRAGSRYGHGGLDEYRDMAGQESDAIANGASLP